MGSSLVIFLGLLLFLCLSTHLEAQLQVGFYDSRCNGTVESVVRAVVKKAFCKNPGVAAGLLRMHFHDCFVRGCDGSVLIDSTNITAEKNSPANFPSLRGFEVIDESKSILEGRCKGVVSCADILAFAARDGVELTRGFRYDVPAGRRDGRISLASEIPGNIPPPTFNLTQNTQLFAKKGLTQEEMVTLSGGHSIGRSHCTSITSRLYNFSTTTKQDPSLDPTYANQLKQQCPEGSKDNNSVVPMDPGSPNVLDSGYYQNILINRGLFTSDQTLISSFSTARQVRENAANVYLWRKKFGDAMVKMGNIGVLTGNNGEIRLNCRVIN